MNKRTAKRVSKSSANSKPLSGTMALLEDILRRTVGWADGIVSPFALRNQERPVRVRKRAA